MIDYQRLYHTGIRVPDLDAAMAEMGEALGVTWASVMDVPEQQVWTPQDGPGTVPLRFVYSCEGPQHIELLQGAPGSIWDGTDQPGVHHVGLWVDDVAAETQRGVDMGWSVAAAHAAPDDGYGVFTYVQPRSGPIVELVWSAVQPRFEQWWAGGSL
jgi:catechol 2,3-dioxygenase-like lactoylglutathione lyase family enzyme